MEAEMLDATSGRGRGSLRSVDPSTVRDASAPILRGEQDQHAEVPEQYKSYSHAFLNRPRNGDVLEERFWMEYINGHTLDGKIRVLMRSVSQGESSTEAGELVLENELEKDANGLKHLLTRPASMAAGKYRRSGSYQSDRRLILNVPPELIVQKQLKDGSFVDDVTTEVVVG